MHASVTARHSENKVANEREEVDIEQLPVWVSGTDKLIKDDCIYNEKVQ